MPAEESVVSKEELKSTSDLDLVRKFRATGNSGYVSELIERYKYFLLKVLSRWNSCNKYCVKLNSTDFEDAKQYVYMSVMLFAHRVKDLSRVKNVSVSLKCYAYTTLNKYYRHRRYENTNCEEVSDILEEDRDEEENRCRKVHDESYKDSLHIRDFDSYCILMCRYTHYKTALLFTGLKTRASMKEFHKEKKSKVRDSLLYD